MAHQNDPAGEALRTKCLGGLGAGQGGTHDHERSLVSHAASLSMRTPSSDGKPDIRRRPTDNAMMCPRYSRGIRTEAAMHGTGDGHAPCVQDNSISHPLSAVCRAASENRPSLRMDAMWKLTFEFLHSSAGRQDETVGAGCSERRYRRPGRCPAFPDL